MCQQRKMRSNIQEEHDVTIMGGGHNSLASGPRLTRIGLKLIVLERRKLRADGVCPRTGLYPPPNTPPAIITVAYTMAPSITA